MASNDNSGTENETGTRGRGATALDAAREGARSAYETARDRSRQTARQVTDQMTVYPVGAVLGGLALGALIGFLVPRTERENRLLGPTGRKLAERAREAAQTGIEAGRERVQSLSGELGGKAARAVVEAVGGKE